MSTTPIVVLGAGYLGRRVVTALADPATLALGRSSGLDLDKDSALPVALPPVYRLLYTVPPSPEHDEDVRLARLLVLLDPLPERFVYISTTGVYGDCDGNVVDEEAPVQPGTARARRRVAAEALLQSWATDKAVHLKLLRTPGIYGPGRLGLQRIRDRQPLVEETAANPGNRIHVDDLVTCCIAALSGDAAAGTYNLGDGDHRSPTWFRKEIARQAGLPMPPEVVAPESRESRRVATRRMREQLGVMPKYADAADGIRASLTAEE